MTESSLPTRYDAPTAEPKWYAAWENAGLFQPDSDPDKARYTITIPPPNITGSLHMGHALCYPIQDLLGRYNRMLGKSVLVLPGQDHAGIATQSVVEKQLRAEGSSGAQLGRERFVERVWAWRKESGDTILNQLRRLGCAFDWSRQRFTLDDAYAKAVLDVFIDWFNRGLIYRGKRVVNWDPVLRTSVSDIETERKLIKGKLYYIRYPFVDGSGEVVIATTRPETMLADVAVAVHPSDERYKGLVGKTLRLPLMDREIPLLADSYPDPAFGSGAVKITPAHDPNDYEVGVRHGLSMPVLLDERARVTDQGGKYAGLDRYEARKRVVADLEEGGFLVKVEDYEIAVLLSDRSKEVIEPLLSEQWFCKQSELAGASIDAVKKGAVSFVPERYDGVFIAWMENIRDWCISRQLWWGHRIPVYYTADNVPFAAHSWEEAQALAGDAKIVRQDDDVLDTWFSSGLWPFATLGWPEQSADLAERYPTSVLVTDRNIINLWVARMMMMGFDLVGKRPFDKVMIYATVLTEDGKRMSKSLGTGLDPMSIIETVGADALRYALLSQTGANQDIRFGEGRVTDARNFSNKIWNATRFVLLNVESAPDTPESFEVVDRWLLSRLAATEKAVKEAYDVYDLQLVCQTLYRFFWSEVCDWYIEVSKGRLANEGQRQTPQWVLLTAIDTFLKMMHPVMPHLTEELYSHLPIPGKSRFIMEAAWPTLPAWFSDTKAERMVEEAFEVTRAIRALRAELDITPGKSIDAAYYEGSLAGLETVVSSQAWVSELRPGKPSTSTFVSASAGAIDVHLPLEGLMDEAKKREKIERIVKETEKLRLDLSKLQERLGNPMFVDRAKPEVIERDRQTVLEIEAMLIKLDAQKSLFG